MFYCTAVPALSAINDDLLKTTVAVDPNPPVVEKTNGEKEPNSISRMRCSYARFFSSSATGKSAGCLPVSVYTGLETLLLFIMIVIQLI